MNLQVFKNNEISAEIRTVKINNEPWFVANDVCAILNHTNPRKALQMLDDDEKGVTKGYTLGGVQEMNVVSESGLYALIIRSNKPEAKKFRKWVTSEVLPAIRKTGSYNMRYTPKTHTELLHDFSNLMYREIVKVESNRVRNRMAGILDFYLIQSQNFNPEQLTGQIY